ncbi:unnamed protein product [Orchesella dallaii]|uniref:Gustatory receptor n=1 Tax=Orchesella dallaii TaxID=48710 RepID=A0ABP1PNE3_9HEXA
MVIIGFLRYAVTHGTKDIPTTIQSFNITEALSSAIYSILAIKRYWWSQKHFVSIFEVILKTQRFEQVNSKALRRPAIYMGFTLIGGIKIVSNFIHAKWIIPKEKSDYVSGIVWFQQMTRFSKFVFFLDRSDFQLYEPDEEPLTLAWLNPLDYLLALITILGTLQCYIADVLNEHIILGIGIMNLVAAQDICKEIEADDDSSLTRSWIYTCGLVKSMEDLSMACNKAMGSHFTWSLAETILFLPTCLTDVATSPHLWIRIDLAISYLVVFATLFISAAAKNKVSGAVEFWLSNKDKRENITSDQCNTLLAAEKRCGIQPSGMFTVTYGFIGAVS